MDQQLLELFDRFAALAFDRQQRFAEFTARKAPGAKKHLEVELGLLSFGPKLQFEALLAGVHQEINGSWMWAWANRTIKLSLTNRALGDTIRALAHKAMTPTFAKHAFPIDPALGADLAPQASTVFGTILVGELDYDAYLVSKLDGHPALFLIRDERLRSNEKHPLARILTTFPKAMSTVPANDHRAAFTSYVLSYGFHPVELDGRIHVKAGKSELTATFDDRGRLKSLKGENISMPKARSTAEPKVKKKAPAKAQPAARAKAQVKAKRKSK